MLLAGILSAALLAGCGSSAASSGTTTSSGTAAASSAGMSVSSIAESTGASSASSAAASETSSTDSSSGSNALTPVKANEPYSIDVIYKTTSNEYTKYLMAGVQAAANDAGVTVEQKGATSETAYEEQQNMIETDLVSNKFDAMVVIPLQGDIVSTLVANTSIPIFAMDTDFNSDKKVALIGCGQENAAKMGAEEAYKAAKEAGWDEVNLICLAGVEGDSTAEARKVGYQKGVEAAGGTFMENEVQYTDAVADKAVVAMEGIMQNHPEGVAIIACHNDDCAMAAARTAKGNEAYKNTIFLGFDGISSACQSILDGYETMTVAQNPYDQGYASIMTAVRHLNGESVESFVNTGASIVTKENAQENLDKMNGYLAMLKEE